MRSIFIFFLFLSFQVSADNLSDSNKLFDWAEENFPEYFSSANQETFEVDVYLARYYPETGNYLGTSGNDVYVLGDVFGGLVKVGLISDFIDVSETPNTTEFSVSGGYLNIGTEAINSESVTRRKMRVTPIDIKSNANSFSGTFSVNNISLAGSAETRTNIKLHFQTPEFQGGEYTEKEMLIVYLTLAADDNSNTLRTWATYEFCGEADSSGECDYENNYIEQEFDSLYRESLASDIDHDYSAVLNTSSNSLELSISGLSQTIFLPDTIPSTLIFSHLQLQSYANVSNEGDSVSFSSKFGPLQVNGRIYDSLTSSGIRADKWELYDQ